MNPIDKYSEIQALVQKDAKDVATSVYKDLGNQYGVPEVPFHIHNGIDSPKIDYNNLLNTPTESSMPSGSMMMYAGSSAPTGYLFCDGSAVSRTTYATLFGVLGTTYGAGDASTTFNVPDMRGRAPVGVGTGSGGGSSGTGLPSGGSALTARARGDWLGEQTHALITAELAAHTHDLSQFTLLVAGSGSGYAGGLGQTNTAITNGATASTGSGTAHNNIQPVMTVNFIIKI